MAITTKHTKSTKEENIFFKIRCPLCYPIFVSFATFVVRKQLGEFPGENFGQEFARAAQISNYGSTKSTKFEKNISETFVSFVIFVVRSDFVVRHRQ